MNVELEELYNHRVVTDIRQSKWMIRRTFKCAGHKLRVTIAHDPYMFQCDYYLEVFSPTELKWNRIHTEASDGWYRVIDALDTNKLTPEQWEQIDMMTQRMVLAGSDLLEGVEA